MKKILLTLIAMAFIVSNAVADDKVVSPDTLPQAAKAFISSNFAGANATYVEKDFDSYDVQLSNGVKIDFTRKGDWKKVESMQAPVPASVIPAPVADAVAKAHQQAAIMEVEKERGNFEIKLNNMMKLVVNPAGQIIGQKMDD